jgi:hypothetical protein
VNLRSVRRLSALAVAASLCAPAHAQLFAPGDEFVLGYGPKTLHFHPSDEHVKWTNAVLLELQTDRTALFGADRALFGVGLFDNSFGQFSQYVYWGQKWNLMPLGPGDLYAKLSVGILHGYKGAYQDKIPFNDLGYAPAIVPTIGYRYDKASAEVALLGTAGLIFIFSWAFGPR